MRRGIVLTTLAVAALALVALVAAATAPRSEVGQATSPLPTREDAATPGVEAATPSTEPEPTPDEPTPDANAGVAATSPIEAPALLRLRGRVPPDVLDGVRGLPGVEAATLVRSETVGLFGSSDAAGAAVDRLADGYRIPVAVTAIDPTSYLDVHDPAAVAVPEEGSELIGGLQPGQVLLTPIGAELRAVGPGGTLDLGGVAGLVVAGVLPEDAVGRAEVVVHTADADAIGVPPTGSLVVRHAAAPGAPTEHLAAAVTALVPQDAVIRITTGQEPATPGAGPLVLSLPELKARFGEFSFRPRDGAREIQMERAFVDEHIVSATVPLLGTVTCHRDVVAPLRAALDDVVDAGFSDWVQPNRYGGCYYARRINVQRERLSTHSWGAAIDINVDLSIPGLGPVPPDEVIHIFGTHGFRWGGDLTTPDNHHWEWVGEGATARRER